MRGAGRCGVVAERVSGRLRGELSLRFHAFHAALHADAAIIFARYGLLIRWLLSRLRAVRRHCFLPHTSR